MKLKDTLALIKAGYTKEEIRAFDAEKGDPEQGGDNAGIVQAIGLMADQLNSLQAAFTKGTQAAPDDNKSDINTILAKLQGSGEKKEEN